MFLFDRRIKYGRTEILKLLLEIPKVDPTVLENLPLLLTKYYGHLDTMFVLLNDALVDPSCRNNLMLMIWAAHNGLTDLVKFLLKDDRVDPSAKMIDAVFLACNSNHSEVVKLLMHDARSKRLCEQDPNILKAAEAGDMETCFCRPIVRRIPSSRKALGFC